MFDYEIEKITEPAILVRLHDEAVLLMGELRVATEEMVLTNKEALIDGKKTIPSFASLFKEDSYKI